jgi:GH25 family lysozyme M1 (1,4-beta-N-acetylmuramidase)
MANANETAAETQATIMEDAPVGTVNEDTGSADAGTRTEDRDPPEDAASRDPTSDTDASPQDAASDTDASPQDAASRDPASDTDASPQDAGSNANAASTSLASTTASDDAGPADTSTPTDDGTEQDPGQPYLFVDLYSGDDGRLVGKQPAWQVLANTKGFFGAILKAWDGTKFNDGGWFRRHWPAVRDAGGDRYGVSWFRGAYLFLEFSQSPADQADAYLAAIEAAGDWGPGDILPIIDAEQGGEGRPAANGKPAVPPHPNRRASKQQVIDCVTACADRIRERIGRRVILYGRGIMRDLGIKDRMGCDLVWNPAYTATMVRSGLDAWGSEDVVLWQYCGDGTAVIASLPHSISGFGACDISVFVKGAQRPTLQLVRDNLLK